MSLEARYEFHDSRSAKYWQLIKSGSGYVAQWGKVGAAPQQGRELSYKEAEKKIKEKIAKGYEKIGVKRETESGHRVWDKPENKPATGFADAFAEMYSSKEDKKKIKSSVKDMVKEECELCVPSRCTATLPELIESEKYISEEKLDGSRYVLYMGVSPYERKSFNNSPLLSRRASTVDGLLSDKSANIPHVTNYDWATYGLEGTVLDGEAYHPSGEFTKCNSIMNSSPSLAVHKQEDDEKLQYIVFDIMFFKGVDVRGRPWHERRALLERVVQALDNEYVKAVNYVEYDHIKYFEKIVAKGGEGTIIKNKNLGYGQGWAKLKKRYDVSCVIMGFNEGTGKYKETLGALRVGVWKDGEIVEVATCSGMTDEQREKFWTKKALFIGATVDLFAQSISKDERLRHPIFHRVRDDIDSKSCTMEKLKEDMKGKVSKKVFS